MKVSIKKQLSLLAAVSVLLVSGSTLADHRHKKDGISGRYGFTTIQTCARSTMQAPGTVSIDPETLQFYTDVHVVDMSGAGELTFERNGRFTLTGDIAAEFDKHDLTAGVTPINGGFDAFCEGTYVMTSDTTFDVHANCEIDVASQGITIKAGPVLTNGYISRDRGGLTMNLKQGVQTLTAYVDGNPVGERQRVCMQHFDAVRSGRL